MPLFASGIKLNSQLRDPLNTINQGAQSRLQAALGRIGIRQTASNKASGRVEGTYAPEELGRAGTTASTGIEDSLRGALGDTSYSEYLKEQEHQRNLALAKQIGDLMSPSVLEQVLGGLGGGAKVGGQAYGLYNSLKRPPSANSLPPSLSLYNTGASGLARYS